MMSMSPTVQLEAKTTGKGLFGTLKAAVGGEGFFASLFTAVDDPAKLFLVLLHQVIYSKMELNHQTIYTQAGAYLAGSPELELSTKGSAKALFSGEGLFLSKISGTEHFSSILMVPFYERACSR